MWLETQLPRTRRARCRATRSLCHPGRCAAPIRDPGRLAHRLPLGPGASRCRAGAGMTLGCAPSSPECFPGRRAPAWRAGIFQRGGILNRE
ncbi:MAG: hypothetical protein EKK41_02935 [Hyphomicrobiales bacterium]|nr:MAG: hypothetical protein EKK41_02935 [Hyphomicrobiales bacterium]